MTGQGDARMIQSFTITVGKPARNDDMVLVKRILNQRLVGVIGDFTSDSSAGVNEWLANELGRYLDSCLGTWREHLIEAQAIVQLVVRYVNKWLFERKERAKTTLVAVVFDSFNHTLSYACIGDSGLAVIRGDSVRFLNKGDVTGFRDAAGFLPLDTEIPVHVEKIQAGDAVFAFTDGFWENTGHIEALHPSRCEPYLADIFRPATLREIQTELRARVIDVAAKSDDLTLFVMKEEDVLAQNSTHGQDPMPAERLEALIEKKAAELLDRKVRAELDSRRASPMEHDLAERLRATNNGIAHLEKLQELQIRQVGEELKAQFEHYRAESIEQLNAQFDRFINVAKKIETTEAGIVQLGKNIEDLGSRLTGLEKSWGKISKKAGRSEAEGPNIPDRVMDLELRLGHLQNLKNSHIELQRAFNKFSGENLRMEQDFAEQNKGARVLHPGSGTITARMEKEPNPVLIWIQKNLKIILSLSAGVLVFVLIWAFFPTGPDKTVKTTPDSASGTGQERPAENPAPTKTDTPPPPPLPTGQTVEQKLASDEAALDSAWRSHFANIPVSEALLVALGLDRTTLDKELIHLGQQLVLQRPKILENNTKKVELKIDLAIPVAGRSSVSLTLNTKRKDETVWKFQEWIDNFLKSAEGAKPDASGIYFLWLQMLIDTEVMDGVTGPNTRTKLAEYLETKVNIPKLRDLAAKLSAAISGATPGFDLAQPIGEDWAKAVGDSFMIQPATFLAELNDLATSIKKEREILDGKTYIHLAKKNVYAVFANENKATPLETWHRTGEASPGRAVFLVWLAAKLGLAESGGEIEPVIEKINHLKATTALIIASEIK